MKKVIIKCFYKIKFSIFACNFFGKYYPELGYILYKNNIRL